MAGKGHKRRPTNETAYQTNHRRYHATTEELREELAVAVGQSPFPSKTRKEYLRTLTKLDKEKKDG